MTSVPLQKLSLQQNRDEVAKVVVNANSSSQNGMTSVFIIFKLLIKFTLKQNLLLVLKINTKKKCIYFFNLETTLY